MKGELSGLLNEIELIIAKIADFDSKQLKFSYKERNDLTQLFHNKIKQAKALKSSGLVSLAS